MTGMARGLRTGGGLVLALGLAGPAAAITINVTEIGAGATFPIIGTTAAPAPTTIQGFGTLSSVVTAAANYWSDVITAPGILNLSVGWADLTGATLAEATQYIVPRDFAGNPDLFGPGAEAPGKDGIIEFDGSNRTWFADATPFDASEFTAFNALTENFGGGEMNTGRQYLNATGDAAGAFDLFTVAVHEIGHQLGFTDLGFAIDDQVFAGVGVGGVKGLVDIGPFAGADLPFAEETLARADAHFSDALLGLTVMDPDIGPGERRLLTDADVAAVHTLSRFSSVDYAAADLASTAVVPLPASAWLMVPALGLLWGARRRRSA